jgi:hypothetical protein
VCVDDRQSMTFDDSDDLADDDGWGRAGEVRDDDDDDDGWGRAGEVRDDDDEDDDDDDDDALMYERPRVFVEAERRASAEAAKREAEENMRKEEEEVVRAIRGDPNPNRFNPYARENAVGLASVGGEGARIASEARRRVDDWYHTEEEEGGTHNDDDRGGGGGGGDDDDDDVPRRTAARRQSPASKAVGGGSRMAMLPQRDVLSTQPWRARLPHFTPVDELPPQGWHQGELVHVDYLAQFGGTKSSTVGAVHAPRPPNSTNSEFGLRGASAVSRVSTSASFQQHARWYTDSDGRKIFVDSNGVKTTGKAAYKASQKATKISTNAAVRA